MARMAVAEMVTNIAACKITSLSSIRCEANWMWPAKMPGEAAKIYQAVESLRDVLLSLGIAVDGGKDSLSMVYQLEFSSHWLIISLGNPSRFFRVAVCESSRNVGS